MPLKPEDRKLAWAAVIVVAVIALELAWLILVGPPQAEAHQQTNQEAYYWIRETLGSAAFWTAAFTGLLVWSTWLLWRSTSQSVRIAERALTELERAHVFAEIADPGISVAGTTIGQPRASFSTLILRFFNIGRTPAFLTNLHWDVVEITPHNPARATSTLPPPFDPAVIVGRTLPAGIVVGEARRFTEAINLFGHISMQARFDVPNGVTAIWCHGLVRYRDALDERYITGFCFLYDTLGGGFVQWGDERYNYARKDE